MAGAVLYDAAQYPLLAAAESGDASTVSSLLNADANVNQRTSDGWSALIMAAKEGHSNIVTQLLMADASINPPKTKAEADTLGIDFLPPSHTALRGASLSGKLSVVKLLLENEADPNQASSGGKTPLMGAAMNGHADVVELLCGGGADASVANEFGETARALAEAQGHAAIAESIRTHETADPSGCSQGLSVGQAADLLAGYLNAKADHGDGESGTLV